MRCVDRLAQNLILFIRQNGGTLSKRNREKSFFSYLTDDEVHGLESIIQDAFDGFVDTETPE